MAAPVPPPQSGRIRGPPPCQVLLLQVRDVLHVPPERGGPNSEREDRHYSGVRQANQLHLQDCVC